MRFELILCALCATSAAAKVVSYEGFKTYLVTPSSEEHLDLFELLSENQDVDFWSTVGRINDPVTLMIAPKMQDNFVSMMEIYNIEYKTLVENVESIFEAERIQQSRSEKVRNGTINFTAYHRYATIQEYLNELEKKYPNIVKVKTIGLTSEKRNLSAILIGSGSEDNKNILIDGGIHAREWISPAFVTYIIHQLVENKSNRKMLENVNWHIIPVLNPDGYEYSHEHNRLWRKTRSCRNGACHGVDANRNFDFHWMETGASSFELSNTYAGPHPFSEPETMALRDYALSLNSTYLYLTFHSNVQAILYPWAWTSVPLNNTSQREQLHSLGTKVEKAISAVAGTKYRVGAAGYILKPVAGISQDWMFAVAKAPFSYSIELPERTDGFELPAERILSVCRETWQGIITFYHYITSN